MNLYEMIGFRETPEDNRAVALRPLPPLPLGSISVHAG